MTKQQDTIKHHHTVEQTLTSLANNQLPSTINMPSLHSTELVETLSPYTSSLELILRSIHTILTLTIKNNFNILPPDQTVIRQRLQADKNGLEEMITHIMTCTSRVTSIYEGWMFINDLNVITHALGILLLGVEGVEMGYTFSTGDVVRYTRQQIGEMLSLE